MNFEQEKPARKSYGFRDVADAQFVIYNMKSTRNGETIYRKYPFVVLSKRIITQIYNSCERDDLNPNSPYIDFFLGRKEQEGNIIGRVDRRYGRTITTKETDGNIVLRSKRFCVGMLFKGFDFSESCTDCNISINEDEVSIEVPEYVKNYLKY